MKGGKALSYILAIATAVLALGADQLTKYIVATKMQLNQTIPFLHDILDFTYIHNDGGAWGMFGGSRWMLLGVTSVMMIIILILLIRNGFQKPLFFWSGCLIISGGLGNMIDRIFRDGLVVDFLQVKFIRFPIFNLADCAVVIGAGLLILYLLIDIAKESREKKKEKPTEEESE